MTPIYIFDLCENLSNSAALHSRTSKTTAPNYRNSQVEISHGKSPDNQLNPIALGLLRAQSQTLTPSHPDLVTGLQKLECPIFRI